MKARNHGYANPFRWWLGVLALACVSLSAHAYNGDRYTDIGWSANGGSATAVPTQGSLPVSHTFGSASGGATMGGSKQLPWPGKAQATNMAKWKMMATPAAMAKSIVNPVGMLGGFAATLAISTLLDTACVRLFGGSMILKEGAQWETCHMGTTNNYAVAKWYNTYNFQLASNPADTCGSYTLQMTGTYSFACTSGGTGVTGGREVWNCPGQTGAQSATMSDSNATTPPICGTTTGPDGTYVAADSAAVESTVTAALTAQVASDFAACPEGCSRPSQKILDDLTQAWKVELASPYLTGPYTYVEPPVVTVTTSVSGSGTDTHTTTTTVTANTTHTFGYVGDTVKDTTSTKTTTSVSTDGGPAVETSSESQTTAVDPNSNPAQSECDKSPDTLGCSKLDVPTVDVPKSSKSVTFAPDDLGFGAGSCPSPITVSAGGRSFTISYQAECDLATNIIKPLVLAMAALMAYFIAVGGIKEG